LIAAAILAKFIGPSDKEKRQQNTATL